MAPRPEKEENRFIIAPDRDTPEYVFKILDSWLHHVPCDFGGIAVPIDVLEVLHMHFNVLELVEKCTTCVTNRHNTG